MASIKTKHMVKINPAVFISVGGLLGLTFTLANKTKEIGSKIPIVLFFIVILIIGMLLFMYPLDKIDNTYGEFEKQDFS